MELFVFFLNADKRKLEKKLYNMEFLLSQKYCLNSNYYVIFYFIDIDVLDVTSKTCELSSQTKHIITNNVE